MPGCGKTTIGKKLARATGRTFIDSDREIAAGEGRKPADIITADGVDAFRRIETEYLRRIGDSCGVIVATGGGIVTRPENLRLMKKNGIVVFLERDIKLLSTKGRPLSANGVEKLWHEREPLYRKFADSSYRIRGIKDTVAALCRGLGLT